jgi:hypothetical protein
MIVVDGVSNVSCDNELADAVEGAMAKGPI